ncbi:hypothetical protein [Streptomyces graminilatus]|nr:hypothetical protein [Streptomyces graminilatus]
MCAEESRHREGARGGEKTRLIVYRMAGIEGRPAQRIAATR